MADATMPSSAFTGVIIGLVSSFGSVILIALVVFIFWASGCAGSGRILLDRLGRPGEFDDEQAFAREEAEALENMDDMSRSEYLRAKGEASMSPSRLSSQSTHPAPVSRFFLFFFFFLFFLFPNLVFPSIFRERRGDEKWAHCPFNPFFLPGVGAIGRCSVKHPAIR